MTAYTPLDAFTVPEIYDISDLVQGGATGDANTPLKALADQANYLHNRLRRWEGVKVVTDNYLIDGVVDLGQWIVANITDNKTFTLPDVTSLIPGTRIGISTQIAAIKSLTVKSQGAQHIIDGSISWLTWDTSQPAMYMHDAEKLILIAATDHWLVEKADGNFYSYGDIYPGMIQRGNVLVANGILYNRVDVPRLALILASGASCVTSDATWLSDPGGKPVFRGLYSIGNGGTTIRIPDSRAMYDRYLDLGRGLDINRGSNTPGYFEDEMIGPHDHATHGKGGIVGAGTNWFLSILFGNRYSAGGGSDAFGGKNGSPDNTMRTGDNLGTQNIVKNEGRLPLLKY
jgi:hypothetical protein